MVDDQFGDAEAAICDILRNDLATEATVSTDLVGYTAGQAWIRVTRTGGMPTLWMQLDNPVIGVEVHAATKSQAYDLAIASRAAVFAARGIYSQGGLELYDVADSTGITWAPDEAKGARYTFALALVTRPV